MSEIKAHESSEHLSEDQRALSILSGGGGDDNNPNSLKQKVTDLEAQK